MINLLFSLPSCLRDDDVLFVCEGEPFIGESVILTFNLSLTTVYFAFIQTKDLDICIYFMVFSEDTSL